MKTLLVTFTLMILGYCQLNVTAFSKLPTKTYSSLSFSALRNNNNDVIISGYKTNAYKLIRLNVTNGPTTITQSDYNHTASRSQAFAYLFFFNGYIMASATGTSVLVWNQSSLAYLGELQGVSAIGRGQYISYKNVFFYGTSTGNVGYFQVKNMPNITAVPLVNYQSGQFVLPYKSPDEQFVAVSFKFCSDILIYRTSDWVQVKKFKASSFPVYTVCFSPDNRYLMVFIYGSTFVEVYDRDINWTLRANKSVGINNVRTSFYYEQTNTVVAFSQSSHDVFTVNWYDYSVTKIFTNPDGWKMYRSDSGDSMTIFQQPTASKAWFFNINPYCPAFTVWEIQTKKCVGCPVNCKKCVSSTVCSICNANYTLQTNNTCQVCGTGKIYNATSMLCDSCPTNCNVCTSPTVCTTCASGAFLVNSTCIVCPVGNTYNFTSWSCYPNCTANCLTCASSTLCSVCSTNYELTALQKCQACSTGTFYNSSTLKCQTCPTNCTACTSLTSCSSCLSGMFLVNQTCISCPVGNSYNYTSWQCYANCAAKCLTCASGTTCSVCMTNYELTGTGTCQTCAVGTFYNSVTLKCDTCPVNCTSCVSLVSCLSCSTGLFLVNGTCISCPVKNDYNYTSWQCYETCTTNCDVCATNTTCSICSTNYELNSLGQCDICPSGTFYNSTTLTCQSCSLDCLQCSSASSCSVCASHTFLVNASCITCPIGNDYNFTSWQCYPDCTANCQVCASTTACSVCSTGYELNLSGKCQACDTATFYNSTTLTCHSCSSDCVSCTSLSNCLNCLQDFFLVNGSCLTCPIGNSYNYTSWQCYPTCTSNCAKCASTTTCSQCSTNFQLDWSDQCQPCPQTTFYSSSTFTCQPCPTNCTSCTSASHCLSCATDVFLVNGTCIACPVGNDYNYTSWSCFHNCTQNCKSCATINTCSQCSENFELISSGICQACNSSAFYDKASLICHSCPQNCTSCTSATICLSCLTRVFLVNNSCVSCPVGYTYNYTSQKCEVACVSHCSQCSDDTHCSVCQFGYQLENNTCNQCTKGSYFNISTKTCNSCQSNCAQCQSLETCNVCSEQTFLFNSSCIKCPIGNTFDYLIQQCKPNCTQNCLQCKTQTKCQICIDSFTLQNGSCVADEDDTENNRKSRGRTLYDITMQLTVENQFVAMINKVPGSRRIFRQLFAFFLNIDHLWLYIYHNRDYGYYVNRLLQAVKNLQQEKWNLVSDQLLNNTLHIDISPLSQSLNTKINFTSAKYIKIEDQSTSFFSNSLDYFFLNVPLVILIFFFFKFMFHLLFRFQVSKLFREYAFNGYLMLMLVEGNAEEFSYLFFFDCLKLHGNTFQEKFINVMTILIFIVFMTQLIAGFFLIKSFYDQHAKYFYDNCSNTLEGSTHLLIEYGLLNFMLGTAHITLQKTYNFQLLALLFVQTSFISIVTYSLHHNRRTKLYEFRYIEWMNLIASFIRICLIFTYYFDQEFPGKYAPVDQTQMYLIIIYLFNWIIYTVVGYVLIVINLFRFIMQKILSKSQQSVLFDNPYLKRFYNLAKKSIKKKNIKIQTMDYSSSKQNDNDTFKLQLCLNAGNNKEEISIVHKIKLYKNDNKKDIASLSSKKYETNRINFHHPTTISKVSEELEPWKNKIHQRFAKQRRNDTINPLSVQNSKGFKNSGQDHDAKIGIEQINLSRFSNNQTSNSLQSPIKKVTTFSRTENPLFQRKNLHGLNGQQRAKSYYTSELKTTEQNVISRGKPKYRQKKTLKDMFKTNQQQDLDEDQADIKPVKF